MAENVLKYQVDKYARSMGIDPEGISAEKRDSVKDQMIREHYPGNNLGYQ